MRIIQSERRVAKIINNSFFIEQKLYYLSWKRHVNACDIWPFTIDLHGQQRYRVFLFEILDDDLQFWGIKVKRETLLLNFVYERSVEAI